FQATVSTLRPGEDRDQASELHSPSSAVAGIAHTGMAAIFRERNELEAALRHAERGAELCEQLLYFQYPVTGLATLASVRLALGAGPGPPARRPPGPGDPGGGGPGHRPAGASRTTATDPRRPPQSPAGGAGQTAARRGEPAPGGALALWTRPGRRRSTHLHPG